MDLNKITSNFKLFSKNGSSTTSSPSLSPVFFYTQLLMFFVLFGVLAFAYYRKDDLQQFYDSYLSSIIGQIWVFTHLNSNGELSSTYVPSDFSLSSWIPSFQ